MSNLLPEAKMKMVQAEFRDRFVMAGAVALLTTAAVAALMLLPSYLVLAKSEPADSGESQAGKESAQGVDTLRKTEALLKEMATIVSASSSPSRAISQSQNLRPQGVALSRFAYQSSQSQSASSMMTVSGTGSSREVINRFRDALTHSGKFPSVSIPVNAIVSASDGGEFTATLTSIY